ncbi:MAG TPA: alpha/beta fold hydrolase [Candidatus Dormibacteraeota bacterium]|nr:alpha/beta fold hydrolase [Candidatus Dormibacteraeota bacterium]
MRLTLEYLDAGASHVATLLYEPPAPKGVTVVLAHGYSSSKQNLDLLAAFVAQHGFRIVTFDFPGHKLGATGGRLASFDTCLETMSRVVDHVRERFEGPVYVGGHSLGAATALRVCGADPTLAGCISIATGRDIARGLEQLKARGPLAFRATYVDGISLPELLEQMTVESLDAALDAIAGRPLLVVAAAHDLIAARSQVESLFERAADPKTLAVIESDHTFAASNSKAAVLAWLRARAG